MDRAVAKRRVGDGRDYVTAVALSPDGKLIASASDDSTIRVWNVRQQSTTEIVHVDGHANTLSFSILLCSYITLSPFFTDR